MWSVVTKRVGWMLNELGHWLRLAYLVGMFSYQFFLAGDHHLNTANMKENNCPICPLGTIYLFLQTLQRRPYHTLANCSKASIPTKLKI